MSFEVEDSAGAGTNQAVSYSPLIFAVLPTLFFCALAQRGGEGGGHRNLWAGLARMGYGAAKIVFLVLPLERLVEGTLQATPQAQSLISAWMGCLNFSFQLYFALSGAADLWLGGRKLLGWSCVESFRDPFNAGGFSVFWQSWNRALMRVFQRGPEVAKGTRNETLFHAGLSAGVVLVSVVIWRGASLATLTWCVLQGGLLALEWWRGGRSLLMPLPLPIRAGLTVAVVVISNILLYMPSLPAAWLEVQHLFNPPAITVYSVMLDARVATPWPKYLLSLAVLLAVAAPLVRWSLSRSAAVESVVGILLGVLAGGMLLKDRDGVDPHSFSARVQHLLQRPLALRFQEGNERVFVGRDDWLFRQAELDRLTRKRRDNSYLEALLAFATRLQSEHVPLLVVAVPDKAALYPQHILPAKYSAPVQGPGYLAALERLRGAGAEVLDSTDRLWKLRDQQAVYFKHDSHWTPEAMKEVAVAAAKVIRNKWPSMAVDDTPLISASIYNRQDAGDLARDLDAWEPESLWGEETTQVISIQGLESNARSPLLLLGGGLTEVFHEAALSFGNPEGTVENAGFATQLAALLGRPLDAKGGAEAAGFAGFLRWNSLASEKKLVICVVRAGDL